MTKIVPLLKFIEESCPQQELMSKFNLSRLQLLELIGQINQLESNLINSNELNKIQLTRQLNWLDYIKLSHLLKLQDLTEYTIFIVDEVASTNSIILDNITKYHDKTIYTTEYQSGGRGRGDKSWVSHIANDITVSLVYWFDLSVKIDVLPLIVAVAINRLMKDFQIRNKIKWPNDVHLDSGQKICGILVESGINLTRRFVVIGIGLDNIQYIERNLLLASLVKHLDNVITEYLTFGFSLLKREWLDNCVHYQQEVKIIRNGETINTGINIGINDNGVLLINNNNVISEYSSANISIRY